MNATLVEHSEDAPMNERVEIPTADGGTTRMGDFVTLHRGPIPEVVVDYSTGSVEWGNDAVGAEYVSLVEIRGTDEFAVETKRLIRLLVKLQLEG